MNNIELIYCPTRKCTKQCGINENNRTKTPQKTQLNNPHQHHQKKLFTDLYHKFLPSPVSFHRNKNTEKLNYLFQEEHKAFMGQSGYCWEEQGSLGGFTLQRWGRTLTHNGVVKKELKKLVLQKREIKLVFAGSHNVKGFLCFNSKCQ